MFSALFPIFQTWSLRPFGFAAALLGWVIFTTAAVQAQDFDRVLSAADALRYEKIFAAQEDGNWRQADSLIKSLENPILSGHIKYQRYMHPKKYRATYPELHLWMNAYADHPDARTLYKLAIMRHKPGWKATAKPVQGGYLRGTGPGQPAYISRPYKSKRKRSAQTRNDVRHAGRVIQRFLNRGQPTPASEYLAKKKIRKLLDSVEHDRYAEKISKSFFLYAKDDKALEYADQALRSHKYTPMALWTAGLASWRLDKTDRAAGYFSRLAVAPNISQWNASAAAWWASRAYLKLRQPREMMRFLNLAADFPRTFYGLIAYRQLGLDLPYHWALPDFNIQDRDWLMKVPAARRAIALSEAKQYHLAERELRRAFPSANPRLAPLLLSLADKIGAPSAAMRMGLFLWDRKSEIWDAAIYPLPPWAPKSGFKVDRALIYAFMRQESGFYVRARSPAGAKGLMQLMPRTASYLARDKSLRRRKNRKLFSPTYNMELGQKYLTELLGYNDVAGNLFALTIAYNGGPGNLAKWKKRTDHMDDPLFFIEAIPSRETRNFIKRVLTNFWIYRYRLGQDVPTLDKIAAGDWPVYEPQDKFSKKVADNARN